MKFRFFTIPALTPEAGEGELNGFCASHRVYPVERQFAAAGEHSFWTVCVGYRDAAMTAIGPATTPRNKVDYKEVLNEADFALFAQLRTLRKTLAEQEGVPAYALFTNEQLAEMVRHRVTSVAQLREIAGVGAARVEKYGTSFLQLIREPESCASAAAGERGSEADPH